MPKVVKILGGPTVFNAVIGAPNAQGEVLVTGDVYKDQHPVYNEANTALEYSSNPDVDFPQPQESFSTTIMQQEIQEVGEHI